MLTIFSLQIQSLNSLHPVVHGQPRTALLSCKTPLPTRKWMGEPHGGRGQTFEWAGTETLHLMFENFNRRNCQHLMQCFMTKYALLNNAIGSFISCCHCKFILNVHIMKPLSDGSELCSFECSKFTWVDRYILLMPLHFWCLLHLTLQAFLRGNILVIHTDFWVSEISSSYLSSCWTEVCYIKFPLFSRKQIIWTRVLTNSINTNHFVHPSGSILPNTIKWNWCSWSLHTHFANVILLV